MKDVYVIATDYYVTDAETGEILREEHPFIAVIEELDIALDVAIGQIIDAFAKNGISVPDVKEIDISPYETPHEVTRFVASIRVLDREVTAMSIVKKAENYEYV